MKKTLKFYIIFLLLCGFTTLIFMEETQSPAEKNPQTFAAIRSEARRYYNLDGSQKKSGWKQYMRWENFARNRLDSAGVFNPSLNWIRWQEKMAKFPKDRNSDPSDWTCVGPFKVSKLINYRHATGMGRLNCIAFNPFDHNNIWVGAPSGGLWKSLDGGKNWMTKTDYLPNIGVSDILIHPANPDIMYIALGDHAAETTVSIGIMKSVDGGETWQMTGFSPDIGLTRRVAELVMHPDDPDILFAASSDGIYKTVDSGQLWAKKLNVEVKDIEVNPNNPNLWYASCSWNGIFRSYDSGETWIKLTNGLPTLGFSRIHLAVCPSNPQILYASFAEDGQSIYTGFRFMGLYRSDDGGDSWHLRSDSPNVMGNLTFEDIGTIQEYSSGHYAHVLLVSPVDSDVVYIGSINLWKSTDGGRNWQYITNYTGGGGAAFVHVDHHDLVFKPGSSNIIYSCNDGGLYRSDDSGKHWTDLSEGLTIRMIYKVNLSIHSPDSFICGSHDNGTDYFRGEWGNVYSGDGINCFIDPRDPDVIYFTNYTGFLYRSDDGGRTNVNLSEGFNGQAAWETPFMMDPADPSTIYTALKEVLKSTERGSHWKSISPVLSGENLTILEVAPSNPMCIFASDGSRMFCTSDGGGQWDEVHHNQAGDMITDITFHPHNPEIVYITRGGYGQWHGAKKTNYTFGPQKVLRSTDRGETWIDISGNIPDMPVNCLVIDPLTSAVYIGTDLGVFFSPSGLCNWRLFERGLPNVIVTDLKIHPYSREIWAATYGRGLWKSPMHEEISLPEVYPPLYFSGYIEEDTSLFQKRYFHVLEWGENSANNNKNIVGYRLFNVENGQHILLGEFDSNTFTHTLSTRNSSVVIYEITAFDENGIQSLSLSLTLH